MVGMKFRYCPKCDGRGSYIDESGVPVSERKFLGVLKCKECGHLFWKYRKWDKERGPVPDRKEGWLCPRCGFKNTPNVRACGQCREARPDGKERA